MFCKENQVSKSDAVREFTKMSTTIASEPLHERVPDRVNYTRLCRDLCENDPANRLPLRLRSAFTDTVSGLAQFLAARRGCAPLQVPLCEAMLWVEAVTSTRRRTTNICQLTFCNAQSGPHRAFQGFVLFQSVGAFALDGEPDDASCRLAGVVVKPSHDEHVEVGGVQGTHVDPMGVGSLSMLDACEVAGNALAPILNLDVGDRVDTSVSISLVTHERVPGEWNARKIIGLDGEWGPKVLAFRAPAPVAPAPASPAPLPDSDDDFAALPTPSLPKPKPKPKPTASMPAIAADHVVVDDWHDSGAGESCSGFDSDPDDDTESDIDETAAELPPPVEELIPPPAMPTIASTQSDLNIREVGHELFYGGRKLGKIEFIHGNRFSIKAACAAHESCAASSSGEVESTQKCQLIMMCEARFIDKYRSLLTWLLSASELTKSEHLDQANTIRVGFGVAPSKPSKPKTKK